ncbi:SGNH/GDSL hydrolase family protein [Lacticaseibacillus parakribbianus]|uniref:SGNH/GDSL hydrolase family protein n=1 Tax=Lacticaseibacillus parakribbianus TaxID=2970927 RepID=UPI0021CB483B|nr:SGNH/GDSL hydrolase family protein [Lacticaseibacillus parakribbianus]
MLLEGATLYGFGDSLIRGHELDYGLLDDLAAKHHMHYTKFAENGATVVPTRPTDHTWPSDNDVADVARQLRAAPALAPDLIVFDGLTNDGASYVPTLRQVGTLAAGFDPAAFDANTYLGAFQLVLWTLRDKYPDTPAFFVAPHRMPTVDAQVQEQLHQAARAACAKWAIPVVDVYREGQINTCLKAQAKRYSYNSAKTPHDGDGTHLNQAGYQRFYTPLLEWKLAQA